MGTFFKVNVYLYSQQNKYFTTKHKSLIRYVAWGTQSGLVESDVFGKNVLQVSSSGQTVPLNILASLDTFQLS